MAIKLENVHISGAKVGIKTTGPVEIDAKNVTFDNVETPWDTDGHATGKVSGSRITNDPKLKGKSASIGWRKPHGPPLPVLCGNCGTVFPSKNNVFAGRFWELWDNEEPCPICGNEHARLSEGIFALTTEVVQVLTAPQLTLDLLAQLKVLGEGLQSGSLSPEEAIHAAEALAPALGETLKMALEKGNTVLMTVFTVIALYLSYCQVQLQREANASSDAATTQILEALGKLRIQSDGVHQPSAPPQAGNPGSNPTESKAPTNASAPNLVAIRNPKARDLRRKAEVERRKTLSPRR